MSVINTMLKDLEKREKNFADNNAILHGLKSRSTQPVAATRNHYLLFILIGFGFIIALIVGLYFISPYQLVKATTQTEPAAPLAKAVEPVNTLVTTISSDPVVEPVPALTQNPVSASAAPVTAANAIVSTTDEPVTVKPAIVKPLATVQTPGIALAKPSTANNTANNQESVAANNSQAQDNSEINLKASLSRTAVVLTDQERSDQAYAAALNQYNQGQHLTAKDLLKDALVYYPKNKQARQLLAAIHIFEQRPDIAANIIEQGLTANEKDMDLLRFYLQALVQMENYPKAISVMETHFQLTAPDDMAYLAGLYQKNKQHIHAVKFFSQALRLIPANSVWWMGQGISLEALGQTQQALDSYQQAITTGRLSTQLGEFVLLRISSVQAQLSSIH
jgi:MSHA biogenesis protein MshN